MALDLPTVLDTLHRDEIRRELLLQQRAKLQAQQLAYTDALALTEKARALLNQLVTDRKRTTLDKIERLVTYGLQTIFQNSHYEFKVQTSLLRKQVVYSFLLKDPGHETVDIEGARGGGVVNVAAFLLTIVIQLLLDPKARTFVLDERFAHVSGRFVPNLGTLLQELAQRMKLQILYVTHQEELAEAADVCYHFTKSRDGLTAAKLADEEAA